MYDMGARPWNAVVETDEQKEQRDVAAGCHMLRYPGPPENVSSIPSEPFPLDLNGIVSGVAYNPSIAVLGGDVVVNVRSLSERGATHNVLGVLDGRRLYSRTVIDGGSGLEDIRLFVMDGALCGLAAGMVGARGGDPVVGGYAQQVLFRLDGKRPISTVLFRSPRQERNWMPVVLRVEGASDNLRLIYSTEPLVVLPYGGSPPDGMGHVHPDVVDVPQTLGHIRGGSQLVPYKGGWLSVVSQVHRVGQGGSRRVHRFAVFDVGLMAVRLGRLFNFVDGARELCAGLVERDGKFLLACGVAEKDAFIAEVAAAVVDEYAQPIAGPGGG